MVSGRSSKRWIVLLLLCVLALAVALISLFGAVVLGSDEARVANQFGAVMLGSLCLGVLLFVGSVGSFIGRGRRPDP